MRVDDLRVSEGSRLLPPQGNRVGVSASRRLQSVINFVETSFRPQRALS